MNLSPIVLAIPIYFLLIGIELIVEQITKKKEPIALMTPLQTLIAE